MKILKFVLFTAAMLTLASCGDDDVDAPSVVELNFANFAGTYEITFLEGSEVITTQASDGSTIFLESETFSAGTFDDAVYTFDANGNYTASGAYVLTFVETIGSQAPVSDTEIETLDGEEGSYSLNATNRTITFGFGSTEDVTFFDGNNVTVTGSDVEVFEGDTYTTTNEIRLVRIN
ncbi:MAG: hypothetical protein AB8B52_01965 [Winogradskyella sp.]|uniref:hypothetical protein n=1 Tax=Winogradskyella sp. TaxID=1883156 RepID=UPI00385EE1D2